MDTKEAIEFCKYMINKKDSAWEIRVYGELLEALEQGEKYKQMWEELYNQFVPYNSTEKISLEVSNRLNWDDLMKYVMDKIKQKYFPKEE